MSESSVVAEHHANYLEGGAANEIDGKSNVATLFRLVLCHIVLKGIGDTKTWDSKYC
jgi:hypothetical protein